MNGAARPPAELALVLGHEFAEPALLERALTHPSAAPQGPAGREVAQAYERMEFLGDRVLSLALADMLFRRFPAESEGAMARRHAKLASLPSLAAVARTLDLGGFLRAAVGVGPDDLRASPAILADCCEAVLGALYLDGGMEAARPVIERGWEGLIAADAAPPRDAKTELQEWAQARGRGLPAYREVERSGPPHAPEFTVEITLGGEGTARGQGRTKREAEQAAAEAMLARLPGRVE